MSILLSLAYCSGFSIHGGDLSSSEGGRTCITTPPRMRNPPESPNVLRMASIIIGNTKLPTHAPDNAMPEAVALYFWKYWLTTT